MDNNEKDSNAKNGFLREQDGGDDSERRGGIRLDLIAPLIINRPAGKQHELLRDLSETGFKLETETELGLGGIYDFEFALPEGPVIKLSGEVKWKKDRGGTLYYGIRFSKIGFFAGIRLRSYLKKAINGAIQATKEREA